MNYKKAIASIEYMNASLKLNVNTNGVRITADGDKRHAGLSEGKLDPKVWG